MKLRFASWYIFFFAALGSMLPFLSLYLKKLGWSSGSIALILTAFPLGTLLSGPVWGTIADRIPNARYVLNIASILTFILAWCLVGIHQGIWFLLILILFALCRAPLLLLVDTLTVKGLGKDSAQYGRVRLWGSIAFFVGVWLVGLFSERWFAIPLVAGAGFITFAAAVTFFLPSPEKTETPPPLTFQVFKSFWNHPTLRPFWLICIVQSITLSVYDYLYALHIQQLKLPATITSASISCGVLVEIGMMWLAPTLLKRFSLRSILLVAILAGVPRWLLTSLSSHPAVLIAAQSLHGAVFGLWWLASIALIEKHAPQDIRYFAQSFFTALTSGLGTLLAMGFAWFTLRHFSISSMFLWMSLASGLSFLYYLKQKAQL